MIDERINKRSKKGRKNLKRKRVRQRNFFRLIFFLIFEVIFIGVTFPMLLLHGPFERAKKIYVSSAMETMNHQYLATWFLSDEEIATITNVSPGQSDNEPVESTDISDINFSDKDDDINIYNIDGGFKYKGYYLVIDNPKRIKIGVTSKLEKEGETTSEIAQNNNAVAAINGGAFVDKTSVVWTGTGAFPDGIVMSEGKTIWNSVTDKDGTPLFGITDKGVLIVGKYSENELKKLNVKEALSFKPILIVNGKKATISNEPIGMGMASRTAIGQKKDGSIILLVIDGRQFGSLGATFEELQEIMLKLGAINAINLDGGRSTTMYYNGEVVNNPTNTMGERPIPTAVIVK